MKMIVAADLNWGIGIKGDLLTPLPEDMKFFREKTKDSVVIMGRKTLESFPEHKPLKNRVNIVITTSKELNTEGIVKVSSVEESVKEAEKYNDKEAYVIGGGSIYEQMLPYCDTAYVTYIDNSYSADTFIPNLDKLTEEWYIANESDECTYFDIEYYFRTYKRKK